MTKAIVQPANAAALQRDLARLFLLEDKGKPHKSRAFLQIVVVDDAHPEAKRTHKTFSRLGEALGVDVQTVFGVADDEEAFFAHDIAHLYREECRSDGAEGTEHARGVTDWHVYEALCVLVGAGFGVWVPVED